MEKEIIKQTEQNETPDNRRTVFIGAKGKTHQRGSCTSAESGQLPC